MCLLDAVASAANMRSGLTEAFVHNHSRPWTSAPCLTLTGTSGAGFAPVTVFTPPPSCLPSPRCGFAFPTSRGFSPPRYYEDSDSCTAHLPCRSPRFLRHTLAAVPSPTTWTAWTSLLPPRQRLQRFSDFALHEQAHRSSPPNRVRSPTDQQFASGCSPPRLTATRLPSATELWLPPTRTFTVLMWRPHGRTHARGSGHPDLFLTVIRKSLIGVGNSFRRPRPPNRACGSPAHGSPVSGFLIGIGSLASRLPSW